MSTAIIALNDYEIDFVSGGDELSVGVRAAIRIVGRYAFALGVAGVIVGIGIEACLAFC